MEMIVSLVMGFAAKWPVVASILFVIGCLRVVFKPIFAVLHAYVAFTPNEADDAVLEKIEGSVVYKNALWVLDYLASIKIVK
jgi:hypothetical protein